MFPGLDVAIVLTTRSGKPLLMQAHGIEPRLALACSRQANQTIRDNERLQKEGDLDYEGTGDLPLDPKSGKVYVLNRRYVSLYRLVQGVYVFAVVRNGANPYAAGELLVNAAKVLVRLLVTNKGAQVDPDRLARKYGEVYAAIEELVHGTLVADVVLGEEVGSKGGKKGDKKLRSKLSFSKKGTKKGMAEPARAPEFTTLADSASCFAGGPPGYVEPSAQRHQYVQAASAAVQPRAAHDRAAAEPAPQAAAPAGDPFAASSTFDLLFEDMTVPSSVDAGSGGNNVDPFGNAIAPGAARDPLAVMAAQMARPGSEAELSPGQLQFGDAARAAAALPQTGPPGMVEGGLYLTELWRGVAVGSKLVRAGVEGVVLAKIAEGSPECQLFRLEPDAERCPLGALLLGAVGVDRFMVERHNGDQAVFRAQLGRRSQAGGSQRYALYRLPPLSVPAPLAARVFVVPQPPGRVKQFCTVVVELRAAALLGGPLADVVVHVDLPPRLGTALRVTPRAEWCALQRTMRFTRSTLAPGQHCACRIALSADVQPAGSRPSSGMGVRAIITFSGGAKGSLSGTRLLAGESRDMLEEAYAVFHGQLEVRPREVLAGV